MNKFVLSLLLIVLISGCTIPGGLIPGTGPTTKEQSPDLVIVQNLNVIPAPPINAGDQFSISFEIKNQDEVVSVDDVSYNLFDKGKCTVKLSGDEEVTTTPFSLDPLQSEFREWTFKAPSSDDIGHLSVTCPMRFMVTYTHTATSQIDIDVINNDRLSQLQKAGQTPSFTPTLTIGSGPIKTYFDFGASMPVRNETTLPIYITVEDKGTGLLENIKDGKLTITFPTGFTVSDCTKFICTGVVCKNSGDIQMIRKKSPQIRCSITTPAETIEKTYYIRADLEYTYNIVQEASVEIKPTAI